MWSCRWHNGGSKAPLPWTWLACFCDSLRIMQEKDCSSRQGLIRWFAFNGFFILKRKNVWKAKHSIFHYFLKYLPMCISFFLPSLILYQIIHSESMLKWESQSTYLLTSSVLHRSRPHLDRSARPFAHSFLKFDFILLFVYPIYFQNAHIFRSPPSLRFIYHRL